MAASRSTYFVSPRQRLVSRLWRAVREAKRAYVRWYKRRAACHYLSSLDDRMLRDIGISRSQIEAAVRNGRPSRKA